MVKNSQILRFLETNCGIGLQHTIRRIIHHFKPVKYLITRNFRDVHDSQWNFDQKSCRDNEIGIYEPMFLLIKERKQNLVCFTVVMCKGNDLGH